MFVYPFQIFICPFKRLSSVRCIFSINIIFGRILRIYIYPRETISDNYNVKSFQNYQKIKRYL